MHVFWILSIIFEAFTTAFHSNEMRSGYKIGEPVPVNDAFECEKLCESNKSCCAWNFHKPLEQQLFGKSINRMGKCTLIKVLFLAREDPCCSSGNVPRSEPTKAQRWTKRDLEVAKNIPNAASMKFLSYIDHKVEQSRMDGKVTTFYTVLTRAKTEKTQELKPAAIINDNVPPPLIPVQRNRYPVPSVLVRAPNGTVYSFVNGKRREVPSFRILKQHNVDLPSADLVTILNVTVIELARYPLADPLDDLEPPAPVKRLVKHTIAVDGFSTHLDLPLSFHVGSPFVLSMWIWPWRIDASEPTFKSRFTAVFSSSTTPDMKLAPAILLDSNGGTPRLFFSVTTAERELKGMFSKTSISTREWTHISFISTGTKFLGVINGVVDCVIELGFPMSWRENALLQKSHLLHVGVKSKYTPFVGLLSNMQLASQEKDWRHVSNNHFANTKPIVIPDWLTYQADPFCVTHQDPSLCSAVPQQVPSAFRHYYSVLPQEATIYDAIIRTYDTGAKMSIGHIGTRSCESFYDTETGPCGPAHDLAILQYHLAILSVADTRFIQKINLKALPALLYRPYLALGHFFSHATDTDTTSYYVDEEPRDDRLIVNEAMDCEIAAQYFATAATRSIHDYSTKDAGFQLDSTRLRTTDGTLSIIGSFKAPSVQYKSHDDGSHLHQFHTNSASKGNLQSILYLARQYYWGPAQTPVEGLEAEGRDHLVQNRTLANKLFAQAADLGSPEGHYNLGIILSNTYPNASFHHFTAAADGGFAAAQNGLGSMYLHGKPPIVERNVTKAFELFQNASEAGSGDGLYNVASMYRHGMGVEKNIVLAVQYLSQAAAHNHPNALYHLGKAYHDWGSWINLNVDRTRPPVQVHVDSIDNSPFGRRNQLRRDQTFPVSRSCPHARTMLKTVAERGTWGSILGDALNEFWKENYQEALFLYASAAEMGYEIAQDNLAYLWELRNTQGNSSSHFGYRHALRLHKMLAQSGHYGSTKLLGDYMYYGLGQSKANLSKALEYYTTASASGDAESILSLAMLYYEGSEKEKAIELLQESMDSNDIEWWPSKLMLWFLKVKRWLFI